jgi:hypothetical protein
MYSNTKETRLYLHYNGHLVGAQGIISHKYIIWVNDQTKKSVV